MVSQMLLSFSTPSSAPRTSSASSIATSSSFAPGSLTGGHFRELYSKSPSYTGNTPASSPTESYPPQPSQQDLSPHCSQGIPFSRIYPSPPLTGSALKQTTPLPEVDGEAEVVMDCDGASRAVDPSKDASPEPHVVPAIEPLSPPLTVPMNTCQLPPISPSSDCSTEASLDSPATSPTAHPQSDHDDESSSVGWTSDSTNMDWSSPASSLLDNDDEFIAGSSSISRPLWFASPSYDDAPPSFSMLVHDDLAQPPHDPHSGASYPTSDAPSLSMFNSDWGCGKYDDHDVMELDPLDEVSIPPSSPRGGMLHLSPLRPDSDESFVDSVMPSDHDYPLHLSHSIPRRTGVTRHPSSSPEFDLSYLTPVIRSPRTSLSLLPDIDSDTDDRDDPRNIPIPDSPSSSHLELPPISEHAQPQTISPSLLGPPPPPASEDHDCDGSRSGLSGLGLFIRPSSIDPPLARSPSPDDDDLAFLDIQFDPATSHLEVDEFLALREMRRRAMENERKARHMEAYWGEKVSEISSALLEVNLGLATSSSLASSSASTRPIWSSSSSTEDEERDRAIAMKRAYKHELHVAMDQRSEARKTRKREKRRIKEIGALMELKLARAAYRSREHETEVEAMGEDADSNGYPFCAGFDGVGSDSESESGSEDEGGDGHEGSGELPALSMGSMSDMGFSNGFSMGGMGGMMAVDGMYGDVHQLVASMVMKRRENARSLANRKAASAARNISRSPLSRAALDNDNDNDEHEHEQREFEDEGPHRLEASSSVADLMETE